MTPYGTIFFMLNPVLYWLRTASPFHLPIWNTVAILLVGSLWLYSCTDKPAEPIPVDQVDVFRTFPPDGETIGWDAVCISNDCTDAGIGDASLAEGGTDSPGVRCTNQSTTPIKFLRLSSWPGGGVQLYVQNQSPTLLSNQTTPVIDGGTAEPDTTDLEIESATSEDANVSFSVEKAKVTSGITALVLVPSGDAQIHQSRVEAALSLIDALPPEERIGLWVADENLHLMADLTTRHEHLKQRLKALIPSFATEPTSAPLIELMQRIAVVEQPVGAISRFVVLISSGNTDLSIPSSPVSFLRLDRSTDGLSSSFGRAGWRGNITPKDAANLLANYILDLRDSIYIVGFCGLGNHSSLTLLTTGERCTFSLPSQDINFTDMICDPSQIARDVYPYGDTIDLILNDEQLSVYKQYSSEKSEEPFKLKLRIGSSTPIDAKGHFRGQTSLGCKRKSFSIDLQGTQSRRLAPSAAADEFYLISLCNDNGYFRQVLANRIMARLGLFPLRFRFVKVRINTQHLGVYLLLEKPVHTLRRMKTELNTIIRRRFDPEDKPEEVKYPDDEVLAEAALAEYKALTANIDLMDPNMRLEPLINGMDFDLYLLWHSFHTFMRNGDYVDEMFFYASSEWSGDADNLYFYPLAWDMDDLDSDCHLQSRFAQVDSNGILYCSEGHIDRVLLLSDKAYQLYIDHLQQWLDDLLPAEALANELDLVRTDLFAHFDDQAVCAAMVEISNPDSNIASCEELKQEVDRRIELFIEHIESRRITLQSAINTWRRSL